MRRDLDGRRGSPSTERVLTLHAAFSSRDWQRLRSLYHDQALLQTEAAGRAFLGPDEVNGRIRAASENITYGGELGRVVALDEDAALMFERVRLPREHGGWVDRENIYLMTFKDGLLFRTRIFETTEDATACYAEHGITLDVGAEAREMQPERVT